MDSGIRERAANRSRLVRVVVLASVVLIATAFGAGPVAAAETPDWDGWIGTVEVSLVRSHVFSDLHFNHERGANISWKVTLDRPGSQPAASVGMGSATVVEIGNSISNGNVEDVCSSMVTWSGQDVFGPADMTITRYPTDEPGVDEVSVDYFPADEFWLLVNEHTLITGPEGCAHEDTRSVVWDLFRPIITAYDQRDPLRVKDSFDSGPVPCGPGCTETVTWSVDLRREVDTTLEVRKALVPQEDKGRFDLLIDGEVRKAGAGHGDSTGAVPVTAGMHTVGETAGPGIDLDDYTSAIVCTDIETGAIVAQVDGPGPLAVDIRAGMHVLCNATNRGCLPGIFEATWNARLSSLGPDLDLFDFSPHVVYCWDGERADIKRATLFTSADAGLDEAALDLLGFTTASVPPIDEVLVSGNRATFRGRFIFEFSWLRLVEKTRLSDTIRDKVLDKAERKIARDLMKLFRSRGGYTDDQLDFLIADAAAKVAHDVGTRFDGVLDSFLRSPTMKVVPDVLKDEFRRLARGAFEKKLMEYHSLVNLHISSGTFAQKTADEIASIVVSSMFNVITGALTTEFDVWLPELTVTVESPELVRVVMGGWTNPFLTVSRIG